MSLFNKLSDTVIFERPTLRFFLYCLATISVFLPNYIYYSRSPLFESLNKGDKGELTPKNIISALNRAQQLYHLEQQKFGNTLVDLGMGIQPEFPNYSYRIVQPMEPVLDWKQTQKSANWVMTIGHAKDREENGIKLKNYIGYVYTTTATSESGAEEVVTQAILCEQKELRHRVLAPWQPASMPAMIHGQMQCPANYQTWEN